MINFKTIVREPLVHFLLISAGLFSFYEFISPEVDPTASQISISDARMEQLYNRFEKLWDRPPSDIEMKGMIDEYLLDEIYSLQGREMGLDQGDGIIRKRLRQKMEFMLFDIAGAIPPEKGELDAYLTQHAERYRREDIFDFEAHTISKNAPSALIDRFIAKGIKQDFADQDKSIDSYKRLNDASQSWLTHFYGGQFINSLRDAKIDQWVGPLTSNDDILFVRVSAFRQGYLPEIKEIEKAVFRDWQEEKNSTFKKQYETEMLKKYRPEVE